MPVRNRPDERYEPDPERQPPVSGEREVELSPTVEGVVTDGPPLLRISPPPHALPRTDVFVGAVGAMGASSSRSRRRATPPVARVLVLGAVAATLVPWALASLEVEGLDDVRIRMALIGMTMLKAAVLAIATGALFWRLRRPASAARRAGYVLGTWSLALGVGFVASRTMPFSGTLLFDAGLVTLVALAASDERLRTGRTTRLPIP